MISTLIVLLILATFLLMVVAMFEDLDECIRDAELDELWDDTCTGCGRHFVKPGCPVHDPQERRAA